MEQVSISEFKGEFCGVLERVRRTGEPVEILENGEPVAVLYPSLRLVGRSAYRSKKNTLTGPVGDLINPLGSGFKTSAKELTEVLKNNNLTDIQRTAAQAALRQTSAQISRVEKILDTAEKLAKERGR
ncbi:MAG: type II toxin-antitoxin system Phd/YefM family antitoxin [Bryobacteraceae bacterium]